MAKEASESTKTYVIAGEVIVGGRGHDGDASGSGAVKGQGLDGRVGHLGVLESLGPRRELAAGRKEMVASIVCKSGMV